MEFTDDDIGAARLREIEQTEEPNDRYGKTMRMLMNRHVRQRVEAWLASFSLSRPRDVLAMVMVALNPTHILDMSAPQDMIVRAEAERFYPAFKRHYSERSNPAVVVQRALQAFQVWKTADKDKIISFTRDQIARHRLAGTGEGPPAYWVRVLANCGVEDDLESLYGPFRLRRVGRPSASDLPVGRLYALAAEHVEHPYLKAYVRLRAPSGPVEDEAPYLTILLNFLSAVHGEELGSAENLLSALDTGS